MKFKYKKWFNENVQFPLYRKPSTTSMWHNADLKSTFNDNLKKYPDSPHLLDYLNNPIVYSYNNYGFRTPDDFNLEGDGNVFLGCSHTFGIGHHLKDVWSYKLSQKIGGKFYNISEPGSGIFTQYRYLNYFKDKIKFNNVFHFLPDECWGRYEFIDSEDNFFGFNGYNCGNKLVIDLLYEDKQIHMINYIYIDAIRYILNKMGINYYLITNSWLDIDNINPYHKTKTPARDLMHYYVEEQFELFELFYHKYKNNITDNSDNNILLNELDPRKII